MAARGVLRTLQGGRIGFMCPGCREMHQVTVSEPPLRGRRGWDFNGDYDKPTFSPSIKVTGKRRITDREYERIKAGEKLDIPDMCCHSLVRDGQIQFLGDCTHELAGKTVPLQPPGVGGE